VRGTCRGATTSSHASHAVRPRAGPWHRSRPAMDEKPDGGECPCCGRLTTGLEVQGSQTTLYQAYDPFVILPSQPFLFLILHRHLPYSGLPPANITQPQVAPAQQSYVVSNIHLIGKTFRVCISRDQLTSHHPGCLPRFTTISPRPHTPFTSSCLECRARLRVSRSTGCLPLLKPLGNSRISAPSRQLVPAVLGRCFCEPLLCLGHFPTGEALFPCMPATHAQVALSLLTRLLAVQVESISSPAACLISFRFFPTPPTKNPVICTRQQLHPSLSSAIHINWSWPAIIKLPLHHPHLQFCTLFETSSTPATRPPYLLGPVVTD